MDGFSLLVVVNILSADPKPEVKAYPHTFMADADCQDEAAKMNRVDWPADMDVETGKLILFKVATCVELYGRQLDDFEALRRRPNE